MLHYFHKQILDQAFCKDIYLIKSCNAKSNYFLLWVGMVSKSLKIVFFLSPKKKKIDRIMRRKQVLVSDT